MAANDLSTMIIELVKTSEPLAFPFTAHDCRVGEGAASVEAQCWARGLSQNPIMRCSSLLNVSHDLLMSLIPTTSEGIILTTAIGSE